MLKSNKTAYLYKRAEIMSKAEVSYFLTYMNLKFNFNT